MFSKLNSDLRPQGGWYPIVFSDTLRNGAYVGIVPFTQAYQLLSDVIVNSCTAYRNYSTVNLTVEPILSQYSGNSIMINCTSEDAKGLSANVSLNFYYKESLF